MSDSRLRAKTGCFTCRRRRVKCGEEKPSCHNCSRFGRGCVWPEATDMADRRHRSSASRSPLMSSNKQRNLVPTSRSSSPENTPTKPPVILCRSSFLTAVHPLFQPDLELELVHHFFNVYFPSITLPTCDEAYLLRCQSQLMDMMLQSNCVKNAVLASCASNKHILSGNNRYRLVSLQYYSQALKELNQELLQVQNGDAYNNSCLLATVSFLYVHDIWGIDPSSDPRHHVAGAIKLLGMRGQEQTPLVSGTRCFDRILVESVLFKGFLLSIRRPFCPDFRINSGFITHAENLLSLYDSVDSSFPTPSLVLGVPTSLYRLILKIIDCHHTPPDKVKGCLETLRAEMGYWENSVLNKGDTQITPADPSYYNDLMILAASLLLDLSSEALDPETTDTVPDQSAFLNRNERRKTSRWQVGLSMEILRRPQEHEKWSRCFLGAWPMLILGYGATSMEEITKVKEVLSQIRQRIGYGEVQRIQEELDRFEVHNCF